NVVIHVLRKALDAFRVIDVKLQMIGIVVITLKNGARMRSKRLVYDGLDTVGRNNGLLGVPLDVLRWDKLLRDHDHPAARLRLFLVFPAGSVNLRIALVIRNLYMNKGNIGVERSEQEIFFARERAIHSFDVLRPRSRFQTVEYFRRQQRLHWNE